MFVLARLIDSVRIEPKDFKKSFLEALQTTLNNKLANKVSSDIELNYLMRIMLRKYCPTHVCLYDVLDHIECWSMHLLLRFRKNRRFSCSAW